jgi:hypothetical protein
MDKCSDCKLWFHDFELSEGKCIHCEEPWKEHPEAGAGVELPDGPPGYFDLIKKLQVRPVRHEVLLPFAHDSKNLYVEATVYEGEGRYWYIEGRSTKFKHCSDAVLEVVKMADIRRMKMLNEEFEKEFGNGEESGD